MSKSKAPLSVHKLGKFLPISALFTVFYVIVFFFNLGVLMSEDLTKFGDLSTAGNRFNYASIISGLNATSESYENRHGLLWTTVKQHGEVFLPAELFVDLHSQQTSVVYPIRLVAMLDSERVSMSIWGKGQTVARVHFAQDHSQSADECVRIQVAGCRTCKIFTLCEPLVVRHEVKQSKVGVCGLFKSQTKDLPEWLSYHILQGVDHFYLYDNMSPDRSALAAAIEPYIRSGHVTYVFWPDNDVDWGFQPAAINDCVKRFGKLMTYTAVIDIDEFLVPLGMSIPDKIDQLVSQTPNVWSFGVSWAVFGTSGHESTPKDLVIESYTKRMELLEYPIEDHWYTYFREYDNRTVIGQKSLFLTGNFDCAYRHPHFFRVKDVDIAMDAERRKSVAVEANELRINHYHCKSWEDWIQRHKRRHPNSSPQMAKEEFYKQMSAYEAVQDTTLVSMAAEVKNHMQSIINGQVQ